jgi:hypothetical protein
MGEKWVNVGKVVKMGEMGVKWGGIGVKYISGREREHVAYWLYPVDCWLGCHLLLYVSV